MLHSTQHLSRLVLRCVEGLGFSGGCEAEVRNSGHHSQPRHDGVIREFRVKTRASGLGAG